MKLRRKQVPILHAPPAHSPVRDSSTGHAKKSWLLHCNNGKREHYQSCSLNACAGEMSLPLHYEEH